MPELKTIGRKSISFVLNGKPVVAEVEPRMLLSDFLRQELGRTDIHVGCEHGVCGACTIRFDGRPARSCLMFAVQADGHRVDTVESLATQEGALNDLQRAFRTHHGLQCGYCTPGILMSAEAYLEGHPDPSEAEVREMLSGHLCRCTGYVGMVRAILATAKARKDGKAAAE
ncbi:MAG: (2Fe-2S)-binding protein [Rhodospirillales bacterium]|nr:(2Fe-2S)-binding protein [Rhodospirillales bacterium]